MTRFVWATLLALSGWLLATPERQRARLDEPLASIAALDAAEHPAVPRAHEALGLLRQLALRGGDRRHGRQLGASPLADPTRRAGGPRHRALPAAGARPEPVAPATALAFPYDATAPPPGRRA